MRTKRLWQKPRGHMEVFVMRFRKALAIGPSLVQRWRYSRNAIALRKRRPAALEQFVPCGLSLALHLFLQGQLYRCPAVQCSAVELVCVSGFRCSNLHRFASGNNRRLDLAAPVHQLLKDTVELVQMRVTGNERFRLEPSAANQVQRLAANCRRVVEGGTQSNVAIVNSIGVQSYMCSDSASA